MQTPTISGFQLAPQQKRLWQLQQNSSAFYAQCAVCIEGNLQPEILQNAIGKIINQHEILRTNFYRLPGVKTPVMVISDRNTPMWEYLDYGDKQDISTKIQELFSIARQENLNQDSLLRLFLIKLSTTEYILVISLPALCADTQSLKNLVNQISQAYSQCCQNQELSREYIQYTQFSEWQNQLLEDEDAKEAKEYWQQQKINSLAALKLPGEQRGKNSQFVTDNYQLVLSQELVEQISNLAQKYHTSIDIILLACWQILIWRITGESEIVIGTAASRREYEELNDTLGLLATYLPIKNQFTPNLCFSEVLKLVEKTLENAAEWQDYFVSETEDFVVFPIGFEFIPIFEKIFTEDASFALKEIFSYIEPFKVKLTCWQKNNCLILNFDYNVNYFSLENVHRLARQFQTLLTNAVAKSELAISQLEILHQEDYQKLVFDFNQTQVDYSPTKCIHELFAEQAIKNPDHIAVVYENQQITYRELNRKANQLAHYLQKQGVKPDIVVGLCLERSLEIIIGLLGILKAGGAYLPLDPNLPTDAISLRLKEGQVSLVITQQLLVNQFGEETVITIDSNWENIAGESDENPHTEVKPNNLVYVIFTSGSTGKPKGVATEHRQLLNYVEAISHQLHLPTSANYATVSSLSADLGNTMIFPALCRGGCLHIISSARVMNALELAEYCHQYPIDCLKIVPSHLSALLTATPSAVSILPRQCLILGGEAVSWKLISQIQKQAPNCQIFNHYGPTETTIGVLTYAVESQADDLISDPVPLGRPLANTQVYILDEELRPVPL
ncbi:MAG TPA: AMP-binding protein, partial [Nostocaceae cyanobacterium]|nr:AMP-binding protein [Nostocaceae cyanobacterium]